MWRHKTLQAILKHGGGGGGRARGVAEFLRRQDDLRPEP